MNKNRFDAATFFKYCCYSLFAFEMLLGIAHLLWPEYRWGQGRASYFNFDNSLTLASWLAAMQLVGIAALALAGFHRERQPGKDNAAPRSGWFWLIAATTALVFSAAEITRFHYRLHFLGLPKPDIFALFVIGAVLSILLALLGWFLMNKLREFPGYYKFGRSWLISWGAALFLFLISVSNPGMFKTWETTFFLLFGLAYLFGCTFLLFALSGCVLPAKKTLEKPAEQLQPPQAVPHSEEKPRVWLFVGVGGMTFVIIFLQIILFRMLVIFGDYLTANSVISIALLGLAVGGRIGWQAAQGLPLQTIIGASLLLPVSMLLAFGASVSLMDTPLIASILLMTPFACCSVVITIALVRAKSHWVYFIDLTGAAIGALLVSVALGSLREEGSLIFLIAFSFLICACFVVALPAGQMKTRLFYVIFAGFFGFSYIGFLNMDHDFLNVIQTKAAREYANPKVLFSKSSFVGRYDVIRKTPGSRTLKSFENGRIIDTIRNRAAENYRIDPRLPHTLMDDPVILILGLSGDGIAKTARTLGKKVYGIELNPVIVDLQSGELAKYNGNSYENIDVSVIDARSFVAESDRKYDMITLMNTHASQGGSTSRAAAPEYLYTQEAFVSYLDHLTDRGIVIIEEPVSRPRREAPVWKLLATMRQTLLRNERDQGNSRPEQHFFVFQWRTNSNNYIQILMKKTPFTQAEIARLKKWLDDVDHIKKIERAEGQLVGPVRTAKTTLLYSPGGHFDTQYSRILKGQIDQKFVRARNLEIITDDRPFYFDVDPARREIKDVYIRTLLMLLFFIPFLWSFLASDRSKLRGAFPFMFVVALTGLGFLLIEVVLIQRFEIFLGSPTITFSTVLGTLLIFSGLGSLWSGRIGQTGLYVALGFILLSLLIHEWWMPAFFQSWAFLPLSRKVFASVISLAPLAFFMGVPFPFVLRTAKSCFGNSSAGMLFTINAAAGAVAVPLAMNISTSHGFQTTFQTGILIYFVVGMLLLSIAKQKIRGLANAAAILTLLFLFLWPWQFGDTAVAMAGAPNQYRVYGIQYGSSSFREDRVFYHGSSSESVRFAWLFWVIKGNGHTILVDTGFDDPEAAQKWKIADYKRPLERLKQMGISPSDVSDVIATHAHWDHIGSLAAFQNARVWMQETEYRHALSRVSAENSEANGMRFRDIRALKAAERDGRLKLISGEKELLPGVTLTQSGGHTPGSQYVSVETLDGRVIIAGDNTYMYENNRKHIAIGTAVDYQANLDAIQKMQRLAASPFYILPGHDPRVMRWFPKISEGIVEITAVP